MSNLIFVIRHGEKPPPAGCVLGVDRRGRPDETALSVKGWQRAGALVGFFGWPGEKGIAVPALLYAPRPVAKDPSRRPGLTVEPLAARLGLQLSMDYAKDEQDALWRELQRVEGTVLVSWEHKAIVGLANLIMGGAGKTPQQWPDDRYDVVWRFERGPDGAWAFSQIAQRLLPGDAATVIGD